MTPIGQRERVTQDRVVAHFQQTLGYRYLGNLHDADNRNIREADLTAWLTQRGVASALIGRALRQLDIAVALGEGKTLYDANKAVYRLLRYGIKDKQAQFQQQTRVSAREICSGESHYLWGKRYRLEVIERQGKHELMVEKDKLVLYVSPNTTRDKRNKVMQDHYRQQLNGKISALFAHWLPIIRVIIKDWRVQQMKTRWGSCAIHSKRILLNLELAKKPPVCLEYVLVHELIHLLEPSHNARFHALMDHFLPDWKERKALLASYPIAD